MKIYVTSSWRCSFQPEVVQKLRALGHKVYDFRGCDTGWGSPTDRVDIPGGFQWSNVDPDWQSWPTDIPRYLEGLKHPCAIEGFNRDMDALKAADACILVNPCGQSAHTELGWAAGAGKLTAAWCPEIREPDLMLKMAGFITDEWPRIEYWLYVSAMIEAAKRIQGDGYVGDQWYRETCSWELSMEEGDTPEEAVLNDMSYWDV